MDSERTIDLTISIPAGCRYAVADLTAGAKIATLGTLHLDVKRVSPELHAEWVDLMRRTAAAFIEAAGGRITHTTERTYFPDRN